MPDLCRDACAEALFEDVSDDQPIPVAILDALIKVRVYTCASSM